MEMAQIKNSIFYNAMEGYVQISVGDENYSIAVNYIREIVLNMDLYGELPSQGDDDWETM